MTISFDQQNGLVVTLTTTEKFWAIHGDMKIKPACVKSAWLGMPVSVWNEWKIPGAFVPGLIKAGTYYTPRGREFWYVTKKKHHAVTIELEGDKQYDRLVLGFEDPSTIVQSGLHISPPSVDFPIITG